MDFPFFIDIYYIYIPYKSQVTFFSFSVLRHARYRNGSRLYTLAHVRDMPRSQVLHCYARRYKFHAVRTTFRNVCIKRVIADFTFALEIRVFILKEIIPLSPRPRPLPWRYVVTVYKSNVWLIRVVNRTGSLLRCKCPKTKRKGPTYAKVLFLAYNDNPWFHSLSSSSLLGHPVCDKLPSIFPSNSNHVL